MLNEWISVFEQLLTILPVDSIAKRYIPLAQELGGITKPAHCRTIAAHMFGHVLRHKHLTNEAIINEAFSLAQDIEPQIRKIMCENLQFLFENFE